MEGAAAQRRGSGSVEKCSQGVVSLLLQGQGRGCSVRQRPLCLGNHSCVAHATHGDKDCLSCFCPMWVNGDPGFRSSDMFFYRQHLYLLELLIGNYSVLRKRNFQTKAHVNLPLNLKNNQEAALGLSHIFDCFSSHFNCSPWILGNTCQNLFLCWEHEDFSGTVCSVHWRKRLLPSVLLMGREMCVHCTTKACAVQQPSLGRTPKITSKWHSVNAACPTCDIKTFRTGSNQTQFLPQTRRGCSSCLKTLFLPNSIFPHWAA